MRNTPSGFTHWTQALLAVIGLSYGAFAQAFGPFPPGTDVFVDASNTSGIENGSAAYPYNTLQEGFNAISAGGVVGIAPGNYAGYTYLEIDKSVQLIGYDAATTVIHAPDGSVGYDLFDVEHSNVRIAGLTLISNYTPEDSDLGCTASIDILQPHPSVVIEDSILIGNCAAIRIADTPGPGPTLRRLLIRDFFDYGVLGHADQISNSIIRDGHWGVFHNSNEPINLINSTIVNNYMGIVLTDKAMPGSGQIQNVIIGGYAAQGGFGIVAADNVNRVPALINNLFDAKSAMVNVATQTRNGPTVYQHIDDINQVNALASSSDNRFGNPGFVADDDLRLGWGSAAIDAGNGMSAPHDDLVRNSRPVDGNGNCKASWDIGAFETPAPPLLLHLGLICNGYVFNPQRWLKGGCEIVDCCPFCPGLAILDWHIYDTGDPVSAVLLRIEGVDLHKVEIEGEAYLLADDRLLIMPDRAGVRISGLRFPDRAQKDTLRITVESFADSVPVLQKGQAHGIALTQSVDGKVIAEGELSYASASVAR